MKRLEIKKGDKFGKLSIIKEVESSRCPSGQVKRNFLCECECGNTIIVSLGNLRKGNTSSCGCQYKETAIRLRGKYSPELSSSKLYGVWKSMKQRCYDKNKSHYECYGGRGITVCDNWKDDFICFYNWAIENGYKEGLTIDRIDVNGNYEPDNCRWVSMKDQSNNKRTNVYLTLNGEIHTISEWSSIIGINVGTLQQRKYLGWSDDDILTKPVKSNYHKEYNGKTPVVLIGVDGNIISEYSSIKEAAEMNNLKYSSIVAYLRGITKSCYGYDFKYKTPKQLH